MPTSASAALFAVQRVFDRHRLPTRASTTVMLIAVRHEVEHLLDGGAPGVSDWVTVGVAGDALEQAALAVVASSGVPRRRSAARR